LIEVEFLLPGWLLMEIEPRLRITPGAELELLLRRCP
jgi:hypothetical protein